MKFQPGNDQKFKKRVTVVLAKMFPKHFPGFPKVRPGFNKKEMMFLDETWTDIQETRILFGKPGYPLNSKYLSSKLFINIGKRQTIFGKPRTQFQKTGIYFRRRQRPFS